MNTKDLTPEIESVKKDYSWMEILFTHPFIEDIYARVVLTNDTSEFRTEWSSDDFSEEDKKELIKSAREFYAEKVAEYEEEKEEQDRMRAEFVSDAEEHHMDFY